MLCINKIASNSTVDFAAEELKKYLRMMMPEAGDVKIAYVPGAADGFRLGLMQDFGLDVSDAEDTELDDILYIDCDERGGIIAGDNPRSVLLSVYEYLRQNGCRWLFPGVDGELIPMKDISPVKYRHKPSMRYRGWCNEGAEYQECMLETIEFAPKVGLNAYMMEFFVPADYYNKFYEHKNNDKNFTPEKLSDNTVLQWKRACEAEIAKRGLQYHDIGHGWTVEPFGVDSSPCWNVVGDGAVPEWGRKYLAELGGRRTLYKGKPLNTNFCMSSPEARELCVRFIADYAESHSNSDFLHVWLGDDYNNHCECEGCKKKSVSDWYVVLLNELDREFCRRGLHTRIVFISYLETTWAPEIERIENPERFTCMLAPITRSYTYTLSEAGDVPPLSPFLRNRITLPKSLSHYLAYFKEWSGAYSGKALSYEYHFWRHQMYDLSGLKLSRIIYDDIHAYEENGVHGIIEDGSQRSFFPTGVAFYTYARTLFDTSLDFDGIVEEYMSAAFGERHSEVIEYLREIERGIPFEYLERTGNSSLAPVRADYVDAEVAAGLGKMPQTVESHRKLFSDGKVCQTRIEAASRRLLSHHAELCVGLARALERKALGDDGGAMELLLALRDDFGKREYEIRRCFDHCLFFGVYKNAFGLKATSEPVLLV